MIGVHARMANGIFDLNKKKKGILLCKAPVENHGQDDLQDKKMACIVVYENIKNIYILLLPLKI